VIASSLCIRDPHLWVPTYRYLQTKQIHPATRNKEVRDNTLLKGVPGRDAVALVYMHLTLCKTYTRVSPIGPRTGSLTRVA
jgi:hypothetical protein